MKSASFPSAALTEKYWVWNTDPGADGQQSTKSELFLVGFDSLVGEFNTLGIELLKLMACSINPSERACHGSGWSLYAQVRSVAIQAIAGLSGAAA